MGSRMMRLVRPDEDTWTRGYIYTMLITFDLDAYMCIYITFDKEAAEQVSDPEVSLLI